MEANNAPRRKNAVEDVLRRSERLLRVATFPAFPATFLARSDQNWVIILDKTGCCHANKISKKMTLKQQPKACNENSSVFQVGKANRQWPRDKRIFDPRRKECTILVVAQ